MSVTRPFGRLLLPAACLAAVCAAIFSRPGPLHSAPVTVAGVGAAPVRAGAAMPTVPPARTVEGVAVSAGGKPLAHATLYLFGLPPGETDRITLGDQSTVVTDGKGRFVWQVPAALPPLSDYVGVRPIPCYALAADRGDTRFRLAVRSDWHGANTARAARDLLERAVRPCVTKWVLGGPHPVLSVVAPDTAGVTLTVRGPDGLPVRGRAVRVVPAEQQRTDYDGSIVYTGRTDAGGRLRLRLFPGLLRFQVVAPSVGFGATGAFDLRPGRSAAPALPPLAPFARLSGRVDAALAGPGAVVHGEVDNAGGAIWYDPRAAVDAGGRWTLGDVLPGRCRLVLEGGRGASEPVAVTVAPGERLGGLTVGPSVPVPPVAPAAALSSPDKPTARGRVTDTAGRPVAGADVYADFSYFGINGGTQGVFAAQSDAEGRYVIPDLNGGRELTQVDVRLVAHRPGFPPAVGDVRADKDQASGRWPDVSADLTLPALHAGLTVRVLRGGRPLADVPVSLLRDQGNRDQFFSLSPPPLLAYDPTGQGRTGQALRALLAPRAQTGPDGVAHFADLTPGLWAVAVNQPDGLWQAPPTPFNLSTGLIVRAGEDLSYTVSVRPPPGPAVLRVLAPDGLAPAGSSVSLSAVTAPFWGYSSAPATTDGAGDERAALPAPGLVRVTSDLQSAGLPAFDPSSPVGPYSEGAALVAVSDATPITRPVVIPTRRYGPASLRVRLEDARGRPARGTVTAGDNLQPARYAASTDAHGLIVFADMPAGYYTLTARLAGPLGATALGGAGSPFPTDAALRARMRQPSPQSVHVQPGEETAVTVRPQPIGYLRLRLAVPKERAKGYYFDGSLYPYVEALDTRQDPATGEFLVGPLPAGRRTFRLFHSFPGPPWQSVPAGAATVTVEAGRVTRAALVPRDPPGPSLLLESIAPTGTVLLADGKTPAWGARAGVFTSDRQFPLRLVRADAAGRLTLSDRWQGATWPWKLTPGNPPGPVLVAWLPGTAGAAIAPYVQGQDTRLVLPPAVSLRGRVTAGGLSVSGLPSGFRVKAAYQGRGALNEALSVEATAQADGSFELAGLTPGVYRIQAVRDEIWLSEARTVTVGAGPLAALTLDIAPPGAAVVLHLVDGAGRPLAGRAVTVARPAGPLTAFVWPDGLATDGAGDLRVDGLEAGPHRLTVSGVPGAGAGFNVPVWSADAPPSVRRVVVKR